MAPQRHRRPRRPPPRPSAWDWSFAEDGALALDRHEVIPKTAYEPALDLSQSRVLSRSLNRRTRSGTVTRMPSRRTRRRASLRQRERRAQRIQRLAALLVLVAIVIITLTLTAFGSTSARARPEIVPRARAAAVAVAPPRPQVVAVQGALRLQLPVPQERVSAIAYHAATQGALPLQPLGRRGNNGLLRRLVDRVLGTHRSGLTWYQLGGADGPPTSALDVAAPAGTDVYAPVDGTVVAVDDYVLNGKRFGSRIDIQPSTAPALVVSVIRVGTRAGVGVGQAVVAGRSRLGRVLDLAAVERQAIARYTQDSGNHVTLEVRSAAAPALG